MGLSDSRSRPADGYGFPSAVELGLAVPGLPGSCLICRCPLSPVTPPSRIAASARCFTTRVGFTISGKLATRICVTRPNRVHAFALRLTPLLPGASTAGLLRTPPHQLHGERALTMVHSFQRTRSARLRLAHQRNGSRVETRCGLNGAAIPIVTVAHRWCERRTVFDFNGNGGFSDRAVWNSLVRCPEGMSAVRRAA